MTTDGPWTIDELSAAAAEALAVDYPGPPSGRVREVPDRRTIRWYTTIGLLDRATMRGRTALYHRRHLAQLVAIKRLQAAGHTLADVQQMLYGATNTTLTRFARLPEEYSAHEVVRVAEAARVGELAGVGDVASVAGESGRTRSDPLEPDRPSSPHPSRADERPFSEDPGAPFPGEPDAPYPGGPAGPPWGPPSEPFPGAPLPGEPYPGGPLPGEPYPGGPAGPPWVPGEPFPGEPGAPPGQPFPGRPELPPWTRPGEPPPGNPELPLPSRPKTPPSSRRPEARANSPLHVQGRFWAALAPPALDPPLPPLVAGVQLRDSVTLVLPAGVRTPDTDDLAAIQAAAAPLLAVLRQRGLDGNRRERS